jgi:hypothetical protein
MPEEIEALRQARANIDQTQRSLDEQIQMRTMALTMDAFAHRAQPALRSSPQGPPVSARDYLLCRYQQSQQITSSGVVDRSGVHNAQTAASGQSLGSLLDQITASGADSGPPHSGELGQANQPQLVLSVADIERRYGQALSQYRFGSTSAREFVSQTLRLLQTMAQMQVEREQQLPLSVLGQARFALQQAKQDADQQYHALFSKYAQVQSDTLKALTGQTAPLALSAALNTAPSAQVPALQSLRSQLEGLLTGATPASAVVVEIAGNNPATAIRFGCAGLNGCIAALQNAARNLTTQAEQLRSAPTGPPASGK